MSISSGKISCGSIITNSITSDATLSIGTFNWPTSLPATGAVLKTDNSGNLTFEQLNVRVAIPAIDNSYQAAASNDIIAITGTLATTITLPLVSEKQVGDLIYISKEVVGNSVITIIPNPLDTTVFISGNTSATLSASYGSFKIYTNGVNWFALF